MKNLFILATMLLTFGFANAQCKIYNRAYGGDAIGRFEDGKIYNRAYGGDAIGRIEGDKIYNRAYGGDAIGRIEGGGEMCGAAAAFLLLL